MISPITARSIIQKELMRQPNALKKLRIVALREVEVEIKKIQREMISEFENHPITRELEMGPGGQNISGTLGGKGNLFTFIGFIKEWKKADLCLI